MSLTFSLWKGHCWPGVVQPGFPHRPDCVVRRQYKLQQAHRRNLLRVQPKTCLIRDCLMPWRTGGWIPSSITKFLQTLSLLSPLWNCSLATEVTRARSCLSEKSLCVERLQTQRCTMEPCTAFQLSFWGSQRTAAAHSLGLTSFLHSCLVIDAAWTISILYNWCELFYRVWTLNTTSP